MQSGVLIPRSKADFPARTVAYTAVKGDTATWLPGPTKVMVFSTTAAYIEVGESAAATTASTPIPANTPMIFIVPKGTGAPWLVSALRIASDGDVYAKPVDVQAF